MKSASSVITLSKSNLKSFILGLISAQSVNIIGEIYIGEILFTTYAALSIRNTQIPKPAYTSFILCILWASWQLIADIANGTAVETSIKGIFAPILFSTTFIGILFYLIKNKGAQASIILGTALGIIPGYLVSPDNYFLENPWKWGVGQLVLTIIGVYFSFIKRDQGNQAPIHTALFIFCIACILNDSRSMAFFAIAASASYAALHKKESRILRRICRSKLPITCIAIPFLAILIALNSVSTYVFSSEWFLEQLPESSAAKFRQQASGEYGVLIGGRTELLVSSEAFLDSPIFGHGSWALDKENYRLRLYMMKVKFGYTDSDEYVDLIDPAKALIPVHSYIMGALVWGGLFAGIFWIYTLRSLIYIYISQAAKLKLYHHIGIINLIWNILFSPFGANARWATAVFLAALYFYSLSVASKSECNT